MADVALRSSASSSAPKDYTIPQAQEIIVKSVKAAIDGSGAGGSYLPALQVVAPDGTVMSTAVPSSSLAAGVSADVSWFPGLGGGSSGGVTPPPSAATFNPGMVAALHGYAEFTNAADVLPKGASARTFECWGKMNGDPGARDEYFFNHGPQSVNGDTFAFNHNGNVAFAPNLGFVEGPTLLPFTNFYEWNDTNWHHFVLTYDGATTVQLYLDGVAASPLTVTVQNVAAAQPLIIGNYATTGTLGTGFVDEVAVYSGQLSQARVSAHLAAQLTGGYATAVLADNPIVFYRFADAGPSLVMADSSGNGHTGLYSALFTPNSAANNFVYGVTDGAVV